MSFPDVLRHALELKEQLASEGYDDDIQLNAIESETALFELFEKVAHRADQDARSVTILRERARRLEERAKKRKDFLTYVLRCLERTKLELPSVTAWLQNNAQQCGISRQEDIPEQFWIRELDSR